MTENWKKRIVELAKEVHELMLKESDSKELGSRSRSVGVELELPTMLLNKGIKTDWPTIRLNSKINFLIGYILSLEYENTKE